MARVSPATHMRDILVAAGYTFAGAGNWSLWVSKQPDKPDKCITLYDSGGLSPNPRWLIDYPSVQIRVRGGPNSGDETWLKAKEIRDLLLGKTSYTAANSDRIVHVNGLGDVALTGYDDKVRAEYVFNLQLIIEPAPQAGDNREPL